jgi:hypothetical protein
MTSPSNRQCDDEQPREPNAPVAASAPTHAELFELPELTHAKLFELPTSSTYSGVQPYGDPGRLERRRTLAQLLAILRSARNRREPWYVWVVEEWAPGRVGSKLGTVAKPAAIVPAHRPQLRGSQADEAAAEYLAGALGDHGWHELEGLWIFARAGGVPRRAFDVALAALELEHARRGFLDERFVRLAGDPDESAVLRELGELVVAGDAVWLNGGAR